MIELINHSLHGFTNHHNIIEVSHVVFSISNLMLLNQHQIGLVTDKRTILQEEPLVVG
jgi:hypothetical protein